jgi:hypothetical protein
MGTESGVRHPDAVADQGIRARWAWRRVERRAVAQHQRWLAARLRGLSAAQAPVFWAAESAGQETARSAGIVRLRVQGWQLLLAGVASGARGDLERAGRQGRLRLDAAGRYGKLWWIEVISDGASEKLVLLGSRLQLIPAGGGHPAAAPGPAGHLGLIGAR